MTDPEAGGTRRIEGAGRRAAEFAGLGGYNFLAMVRRGFFYTFLLVYLRERLGLPTTAVALIGAMNATTSTLGQILVWGRLSDRTDRRAGLMLLGELIAGIGYLLTFLAFRATLGRLPAWGTLAVVVFCLGTIEFFWSMTDVGYRAALAQVTTRENRGRYLGRVELIGLVGMGAGLYLAGHMYENGEGFTNGSLWFLAAGFILAGVPLIRLTLAHLDRVRVNGGSTETASGRLDPAFLKYMAALAISVIGIWCFQQNHSFFVRLPDAAAASDTELSWIRTAFWVAGGLAAPLAGALLDRYGARRFHVWAVVACALMPLTFLVTRSVAYAVVSLGVFGALLTALRTSSYALAAEMTPEAVRGRHFAVYNAVMAMGWGLAALIVGGPVADAIIGVSGSAKTGYSASFLVGAVLGLLGLAAFSRRKR